MARLLSRFAYRLARRAAPTYIVGASAAAAVAYGQTLRSIGQSCILCPWHDDHTSVRTVARNYHRAIESIAMGGLDGHLSIKAPELHYDHGLIDSLLGDAGGKGIRVHFDSLQIETAERTLRLFEKLRWRHDNLGYTLPARWTRSQADARRLAELDVGIRVVKGQFPERGERHGDHRAQFMAVLELLSDSKGTIGIATHDSRLARKAVESLAERSAACELEQLYGLPSLASLATVMGIRTRVYIPYGHAYLPYAVRRMRERPIIAWWLMRDALRAAGHHRPSSAPGPGAAGSRHRAR